MKQKPKKAFKHKVQLFGKTVPTMILVGLLLAGTGSAALLTSFGTVSGDADVKQSVYFADGDGVVTDVTASFNGELVAGQTTTSEFTLVNNASEEASVELVSDASEIAGISQTVVKGTYEVQDFSATPTSGSESLDVEVTPALNQVKYELDLPESYEGGTVDLEISRQSADNYHVKYFPSDNTNSEGFGYKDPSDSGNLETDVENFEELIDWGKSNTDSDEYVDEVTFVVDRTPGHQQTFAVHSYNGSAWFNTEGWMDYSDTDTSDHESVSFPEVVTETSHGTVKELDLEPGDHHFNLTTGFHVALHPSPEEVSDTSFENLERGEVLDEHFSDEGQYLVDLQVDPVISDDVAN